MLDAELWKLHKTRRSCWRHFGQSIPFGLRRVPRPSAAPAGIALVPEYYCNVLMDTRSEQRPMYNESNGSIVIDAPDSCGDAEGNKILTK